MKQRYVNRSLLGEFIDINNIQYFYIYTEFEDDGSNVCNDYLLDDDYKTEYIDNMLNVYKLI